MDGMGNGSASLHARPRLGALLGALVVAASVACSGGSSGGDTPGGADGGGVDATVDGPGAPPPPGPDGSTPDGAPPPPSTFLVPNPLISRGKPIESPQANANSAFDGSYDVNDGVWVTNAAAGDGTISNSFVKIDIGTGPTKLLLVWHTGDVPDYTITPDLNYGLPTDYTIEVSADGTTWKNVVTVAAVNQTTYRNRGHSFDFTGMRYVRYTVTKCTTTTNAHSARIVELDVFDASQGEEDTWLFTGSGPIRTSYDNHLRPSFPDTLHASHAAYSPALIDIADTGATVQYLLDNLDHWLQLNADFDHWVLTYGLYETSMPNQPADFVGKMQTAIDKLKAAGKKPIVPRFPFVAAAGCGSENIDCTKIDAFNTAIDSLVAKNGLGAAPDLHSWFSAHPEQLCVSGQCETNWIGIEPNDTGILGANAQWAAALDPLYKK